mgnify:CR=1 FL=1
MASLAQVQLHLQRAGFSVRLDPEAAGRIGSLVDKDTFVRAAARAHSDQAARGWVERVLQKAEIRPTETPSAATPSSSPDPNTGAAASSTSAAPAPTEEPAAQPAREPERPSGTQENLPLDQAASPGRESGDDRARDQHKVFGGKAALTWEADVTRRKEPTVALDAALATAPRQYDWGNKIRVQLTTGELPAVAAVLLGYSDKVEFSSHGPQANKSFSVERQDQGFFVRVYQGGNSVRAVPMSATDAFQVALLLLRRIQAGQPGLDGHGVLAALRGTFSPTA